MNDIFINLDNSIEKLVKSKKVKIFILVKFKMSLEKEWTENTNKLFKNKNKQLLCLIMIQKIAASTNKLSSTVNLIPG